MVHLRHLRSFAVPVFHSYGVFLEHLRALQLGTVIDTGVGVAEDSVPGILESRGRNDVWRQGEPRRYKAASKQIPADLWAALLPLIRT
jgi:hypothetical protein